MERKKIDEAVVVTPPPASLTAIQNRIEKAPPVMFTTGSTLLDLIIGGGWALGRIFNLVGDKSTGKTLLAIESFANFKRKFPAGKKRYAEAEAAFDEVFADVLGFPEDVERPDDILSTVEEFRDDFSDFVARCSKDKVPGLYILDSLDALSDDAEVKAFEKGEKKDDGSDKGSYGTAKAKKMTQLFRLLKGKAKEADVTLGIISQIRDNIGVTFGETKMRTGGHALDFYASQIVWLAEIGKEKHTAMGIERVTAIDILANCKKCKVGFPFRTAEMKLVFGYGIDNHISMLNWLKAVGALKDTEPTNGEKPKKDARYNELKRQIESARDKQDYDTLDVLEAQLIADVTRIWKEVDARLSPTVQKYRR